MKTLIALCGPQGSGKTTLAKLLEPKGFMRKRLAAPLKNMLWNFLIQQYVDPADATRMLDGDLKEIPTPYLNGKTPRHAMQTLGTEWRDLIHRDLWLDAWQRSCDHFPNNKIVVDDLRFLHEAERIKKLNGTIVMIYRTGIGPGTHRSEREYLQIKADVVIMNDEEDTRGMLHQLAHMLPGVFS